MHAPYRVHSDDNMFTIWYALTIVFGVSTAFDPCMDYQTLNEKWRNVKYHGNVVGIHCDRNDPRFSKVQWYRFSGEAGNRMYDSCVASGNGYYCGTLASLWLDGGHPRIEDGVVTRTAYGSWAANCRQFTVSNIQVQKCKQGYYVYRLPRPPGCPYAYCGVHDISDSCLNCKTSETCDVKTNKSVCHQCSKNMVYDLDGKTCVDVNNTKVLCGEHEMKIAIKKNLFHGVEAKHLQLEDSSCGAKEENDFFVFQTSFKACGTKVKFSNSSLVHYNRVLTRRNYTSYLDSNVNRADEVDINVQCQYSRKKAMESKFQPEPKKLTLDVKGQGNLQFSMQQFRSSKFQHAFSRSEYPVKVTLRDSMYFQLKVETNTDNSKAFIEECKATTSSDHNDSKFHYLIKDGCVVDNTTTVYKSSPKPTIVNISFQAFALPPTMNEVYLHCNLIACDRNNAGSRCEKGCVKQSRKRKTDDYEADDAHGHGHVVAGPLTIQHV